MKAIVIHNREVKVINLPNEELPKVELEKSYPNAYIFYGEYSVKEYDYIKTNKSFILQSC